MNKKPPFSNQIADGRPLQKQAELGCLGGQWSMVGGHGWQNFCQIEYASVSKMIDDGFGISL